MIEKTAKLLLWLCLVCLMFALACTVFAFIAATPVGFVVAPIACFVVVFCTVKYLKKTE